MNPPSPSPDVVELDSPSFETATLLNSNGSSNDLDDRRDEGGDALLFDPIEDVLSPRSTPIKKRVSFADDHGDELVQVREVPRYMSRSRTPKVPHWVNECLNWRVQIVVGGFFILAIVLIVVLLVLFLIANRTGDDGPTTEM